MYNVAIASMVGFATLEFAPLPTDDLAIWTNQLQAKVHDIRALEYPKAPCASSPRALANRAFIVRWQSGSGEVPLDSSFDTFVEVTIAGMERHARAVSLGSSRVKGMSADGADCA